jgi:hypothetical protein
MRGAVITQASAHDRQRIGRRQDGAMPGARVVGVAVRDHRSIHRTQRVNEKSPRLAEQTAGQHFQPCRGMRH